jgi:hypothetical protein
MAHIKTIADLLFNVENATKISRELYDKNLTMDAVELKTKFTELFSKLTEIKLELADLQEQISAKEKQVYELETALKFKGNMVCIRDAYYATDEKGNPVGDAQCVKCWENTLKKRKLIVKPDDPQLKICPTCSQTYARSETERISKRKKFGFF